MGSTIKPRWVLSSWTPCASRSGASGGSSWTSGKSSDGNLGVIAMCKTAHAIIIFLLVSNLVLIGIEKTANLLLSTPNALSIVFLALAWEVLYLFCLSVRGLPIGVNRYDLQGYPLSPNRNPLWTPDWSLSLNNDSLNIPASCALPGQFAIIFVNLRDALHTPITLSEKKPLQHRHSSASALPGLLIGMCVPSTSNHTRHPSNYRKQAHHGSSLSGSGYLMCLGASSAILAAILVTHLLTLGWKISEQSAMLSWKSPVAMYRRATMSCRWGGIGKPMEQKK